MNGINDVAQAMELLGIGPEDSSGKFNLADATMPNRSMNESNINDYGLNFNLAASFEKNRMRDLT